MLFLHMCSQQAKENIQSNKGKLDSERLLANVWQNRKYVSEIGMLNMFKGKGCNMHSAIAR